MLCRAQHLSADLFYRDIKRLCRRSEAISIDKIITEAQSKQCSQSREDRSLQAGLWHFLSALLGKEYGKYDQYNDTTNINNNLYCSDKFNLHPEIQSCNANQ